MSETGINSLSAAEKLVIRRDEKVYAEKMEKTLSEAESFYKKISDDQENEEKRRREIVEQNKIDEAARVRQKENQHYEQTGRLLG